ncbi:MAG: hypothetical protein ACREJI_06835 [Candidatus Methylomirabilales bacterium]
MVCSSSDLEAGRWLRGEQNCLRIITGDEVAEAVRAVIGRAAAGLPAC